MSAKLNVVRSCALSLTWLCLPGLADASASEYPSKPITMIVPYTAGGPSDILSRVLAERMRSSLGQPIVIENVGGAAGRTGTARVARAAPDGYTLVAGNISTHVVNGGVFTLNYDVVNDFEPISLLAETPYLIVGRKTLPADNLKELIGWLRANPDKGSVGTIGVGGTSHLVGAFFQTRTDTRFQFVPYRGTAIQDLVGSQIDLMFDQASNALPQVRSGTIKAYALTAKSRLAVAPEIPTVDEAGLPEFYASNWYAYWAPKGTAKNVVAKLNGAVADALADSGVRQRLVDLGLEIFPREQRTPEALATFHKAEIEKWWPVIKTAGIKAE